jgi:hypothetical protein
VNEKRIEMENKERLGAEYESEEEEEEQTLASGDVDWSKAAHDGTLDGESAPLGAFSVASSVSSGPSLGLVGLMGGGKGKKKGMSKWTKLKMMRKVAKDFRNEGDSALYTANPNVGTVL